MQDLKDVTEDVYYENFRVQCISQLSQQTTIKERGLVIFVFQEIAIKNANSLLHSSQHDNILVTHVLGD